MAEVIRMPRMSDTMEEGVIVEWHKKVGDSVEPGDILAEVETDKATMDLESYHEGVLLYIGVKEGAVPVNGILAVIGEKGEDYKDVLADAEAGEAPKEEKTESTDSEQKEEAQSPEPKPEKAESPAQQSTDSEDQRIKASPLAKKMAEDANIAITNISGSGEGGRIIKRDVEAAISAGPGTAPPAAQPVYSSTLETREEPVSQMRKIIAKRLGESKFSAPHFYVTVEIDMDNAVAARKQINAEAPPKISFNDIVVKAAAMALRRHPEVNASWLGDKIRYNGDVNIGVAVAVKEGLLVPVIKHADQKLMSEINTEVAELAGKAREKRLQPDQMQGNTFTISNLGMFDVEEFTAIINPPDSCILAVGSITQKPVVKDGQIVVGNRMKVTLSCDHRVVDGAIGAQFLKTFRSFLEEPLKMLV